MFAYLSNIIHKNLPVRVPHCDFSARMSPSDPVEGRVTLYCDAGGGHLKQNKKKKSVQKQKETCKL